MTKQRTTQTATAAGEPQTYFRVTEAAALLRAKTWTIAQAIRENRLPYLRVGKTYVVTRADLDAYAASLRVAAIE